MGCPWAAYGQSMGCPRDVRGEPVGRPQTAHDMSVGCQMPMNCPRTSDEILKECLLGCPWAADG